MLNALFGSALRVKILKLFMLYPEKSYGLPALAKELSLPAASLRHELEKLVNFGLIGLEKQTEAGKEKKQYRVNTIFLLYPEIKALFTKAQILFSQRFLDGLQHICQPKFLALTGLFTNYPEAQTDLLLVGTVARPAFIKLLRELEADLGREINYTILSVKEFNYRRDVMDIFLYNILDGHSLVLIDTINSPRTV